MSTTTDPDPSATMLQDDDDESKGQFFSTVMSNIFLFFLIFGLSATVEIKNMRKQLTNKFAIGAGVAMQFFIMPVLGYLSVLVLKEHGLNEAMGISLLVVTSSPGGSYSNWWCSLFNTELALSVTMTTLSTLLSVILLPTSVRCYKWGFKLYASYVPSYLPLLKCLITYTTLNWLNCLILKVMARFWMPKMNVHSLLY